MESESTDEYFGWLPVVNTVEERLKENSLAHTFSSKNKTRQSTHRFNKCLKTNRFHDYQKFKDYKKAILRKSSCTLDVSDDSEFSDSDYKTFYNSFNVTGKDNSKDDYDKNFVWSYVEKKGLKTTEPADVHDDSIWEPTVDISVAAEHSQVQRESKLNGSFKAAGALPILRKVKKKLKSRHEYNTRSSTSKNSINNSSNSVNEPKITPEKVEEEEEKEEEVIQRITKPDTKQLKNKKLNGVRRNLKSAIDSVSSRVSESSEGDFNCDFVPEDFQAHSTQIFSETIADSTSVKNNRIKQAHKSSSQQPRDSGIEEDSRDENPVHQNIENDDKKVPDKLEKQDSQFSENTESHKKQSVRIIGDETLSKRYRIIAKNGKILRPIAEEKQASPSKSILANVNDTSSKNQSNPDSESDFKSINSDDVDESYVEEKAKESSDEYYDVKDEKNASSSEDEQASQPEESLVKDESTESDIESDNQDNKSHRPKLKNEFAKCLSPWMAKQYKDLKRLRLIEESSQDDSSLDSIKIIKSSPVAEPKDSKRSKKTPTKIDKSSENSVKSSNKKSRMNGKLRRNSESEISYPEIANGRTEEDADVKEHTVNKFVENDQSTLDINRADYSESDTADRSEVLHKKKKHKLKKKSKKLSGSESLSSREQSHERQIDSASDTKSNKDRHSQKSIENDDSKENIYQIHKEEDRVSDSRVEMSTKPKSEDDNSDNSEEDVDSKRLQNNSSCRDSSAISIQDLLKSKQGTEESVRKEIFSESENEKESEDEKTISEHEKKHLQKFRKLDLFASDESSSSESERENKTESLSKKNEKTSAKIVEKSSESSDDEIDDRVIKETIIPRKENQSDESDEEDNVVPSLQTQKKVQQIRRLNLFDDSSDSEDSDKASISVNRHKSQFIRSQSIEEQNFNKKSRESSDDESDDEGATSKDQKKPLEQIKKVDLMPTDDSSDSDVQARVLNGKSRKLSDAIKTSDATEEQNFDKKSDRENDEEDTMSENQKQRLKKMKKLDLMASDESEDSDKEDKIPSSRSRKISNESVKSEDSEDEDKTSALTQFQRKKKSENAESNKESDDDSVHYDSDNVDIKEHKITLPEDLKNLDLLEKFNESKVSETPLEDSIFGTHFHKKDEATVKSDEDEDKEIDNIVPAEVSKRMLQLKRLNLYEDDSSDSDDSLKNNRNNKNGSQMSSVVSKKYSDDSSSDEKESINNEKVSQKSPIASKKESDDSSSDEKVSIIKYDEKVPQKSPVALKNDSSDDEKDDISKEPPVATENLDESVLNDTKEDIEEKVDGDKNKNKNVIIPETQDDEDYVPDTNQSQDIFSSLENLTEIGSSQVPSTSQPVSKQPTPTKPERKKIIEIDDLVEEEELIKSSMEATISLVDISDDEEIFVIDIPKSIFDQEVVGKKLVVTENILSIGDSHYEAVEKNPPPILSCVMNSKKKKYKTVNIRPLVSIVTRRRKNLEDFIENDETEKESANTASTSTKTKIKQPKSTQKDTLNGLSSATLGESKITKKKPVKSKKNTMNHPADEMESFEQQKASTSKAIKRKLYASDHELKDIDSNATDESFATSFNPAKKSKKSKKAAPVDNEIALIGENKDEVEASGQSVPKTKATKKSKKIKVEESNPQTEEEKNVYSFKEDEKLFDEIFRESYQFDITIAEEEKPVKKKAKKRKVDNQTNGDDNSEPKVKSRKKTKDEEVEENPTVKPKKSRKKVVKPVEEPASVQIMKFINDAFKMNDDKHNTSTSSNESRYGALDIERVSMKKNYMSSSSSDESEQKYSRPTFQMRDKSKEKELTKPSTSMPLKKEVKDDKKKIKKIHFDE